MVSGPQSRPASVAGTYGGGINRNMDPAATDWLRESAKANSAAHPLAHAWNFCYEYLTVRAGTT